VAGNVRELQNYVERAVVMAPGDELTLDLLPTAVTTGRTPRAIGVALDFNSLAEELVHLGITKPARGPTTSIVALLIPSNAK